MLCYRTKLRIDCAKTWPVNQYRLLYSQTSVFEHNPFQKAVRKAICSKSEAIFPIKINANNFNPFQL